MSEEVRFSAPFQTTARIIVEARGEKPRETTKVFKPPHDPPQAIAVAIPIEELRDLGDIYIALKQRILNTIEASWQLYMVAPPGRIYVELEVPREIVFFERGYDFEVEKTGVLRFTHWHDDRLVIYDMRLTESNLVFRYTVPEITSHHFAVELVNDDVFPRWLRVIGWYKGVPRLVAYRMGIR